MVIKLSNTIVHKPPQSLKRGAQPRSWRDPEAKRLLLESIRTHGIQDPLKITADDRILDGYGRHECSIELGLATVPCITVEGKLTEEQEADAQAINFLHRTDLCDYDKFSMLGGYVQRHPDWSQKQLAAHLNISEPSVSRWLAPAKGTDALRQALKDGKIKLNECLKILALPPEKQDEALEIKLNGRPKPTEKKGRSLWTCPVPGKGVTITIAGPALSMEDGINALDAMLKLMRAAKAENITDGEVFAQICENKAKAAKQTTTGEKAS